jgi:sodium/hydrogen antiporter
MNDYLIILTIIGVAALGMAWMPALTQKIRVSYSIIYVLLGVVLYVFIDAMPFADPFSESTFTLHITELVVIISLMGTGLKIDERFSLRHWRIPLRLVSITMLLSIAVVALLSWWWFELSIASALLLGAALAPTDPVLASDVQVGPPLETSRNTVTFSLTAEAGLNDGMAFPFTWLAMALALGSQTEVDLGNWFLKDVLYRIGAGVLIGYLLGRLLSFLVFYLPEKKNFILTRDGFVGLSATLVVYGITELVHGYGFISVFVCAVTLRNGEWGHDFHRKLHEFTDQTERILMAIVLILFGGSLVHGAADLVNWQIILFSLFVVFIVRPGTAFASVYNTPLHQREKAAISFYGIKGIGSFFYMAFALREAPFDKARELWAIVSCVVICSIIIHGFSASIVMERIKSQFSKIEEQKENHTS